MLSWNFCECQFGEMASVQKLWHEKKINGFMRFIIEHTFVIQSKNLFHVKFIKKYPATSRLSRHVAMVKCCFLLIKRGLSIMSSGFFTTVRMQKRQDFPGI